MRLYTLREVWLAATLEFLAKYCSLSWAGTIAAIVGLAFLIGLHK